MIKNNLNINAAESIDKLRSVIKEFNLKENVYQTVFRGKGLEFDSYRNYSSDDDSSLIDWKASTRAQRILIKQYIEERDLKIVFLIDVGSNMVLGSAKKLKCEFAAEMIAAFSDLILGSRDRVGFLVFGDTIKKYILPARGKKQIPMIVDILSKGDLYSGRTNFNEAMTFAMHYFDKSFNSIIVISDFINFSKEEENKLSLLSSKFETIALVIKDTLDKTLPDIDKEIVLNNPGTNQQIIVNPRIAKKTYEIYAAEKEKQLYSFFKKQNIDYLEFMTNKDFAFPLADFLKERTKNPRQI